MSSLNEFEIKLRRFSLESKLEVCRKIAHTLTYNLSPLQPLTIFDNPQQDKIFDKLCRLSNLFEIEYLALASTVNKEREGVLKEFDDFNDFCQITNIYKGLENTPKNKPINDLEWLLAFLRMRLQQHGNPKLPYGNLRRYDYLFNFSNEHINIEEIFIKNFKYRFTDYVLLIFTIFAISAHQDMPLDEYAMIHTLSEVPILKGINVKLMLDNLSTDREEILKFHNETKNNDRKFRIYDYNPYSQYPLLKHNGKFLIPIPQYLFHAITEGFYHRLCELIGINFREKFGKNVFENCVGDILNWNKSDYTIIREFPYGRKGGKESPDYILVKNSELIFIEIKGTTPRIELRGNDPKVFKEQLLKGFGVGVTQCLKKEQDLIDGVLTHSLFPKNIENIYYLIVVLENFHFPPGKPVDDYIKKYCSEVKIDYNEKRKPMIISVSLLESILEEYDGSIFDFMKVWDNDPEIKFPVLYIDYTKVNIKKLRAYKYWVDTYKNARDK